MRVIDVDDLQLGDNILIVEHNGHLTTHNGVVTRLTKYHEVDLNDTYGLEIDRSQDLIILLDRPGVE